MTDLRKSSSQLGAILVDPGTGLDPTADGRKKAHSKRSRMEALAAYGFLSPWIAGLLLLTIGPMLYSLYLSFTDYDLLSPPEWAGLANYERMASGDPRSALSVRVTIRYVVVCVPAVLVVALGVAMMLNQGMKALSVYRAGFYLPSPIGGSVAIAILWRQVFGQNGIFNEALALVGIDGPSWIGNLDTPLYTLVVLNVGTFGSTMIIFLAGLRQVPRELHVVLLRTGYANAWRDLTALVRATGISDDDLAAVRGGTAIRAYNLRL